MTDLQTDEHEKNDAHPKFTWQLLKPKHWPLWCGIVLLTLLWLLPFQIKNRISRFLGKVMMKVNARQLHNVTANLKVCFPDASHDEQQALISAYFRGYIRALSDLPLCWWGSKKNIRRQIDVNGREQLEQLVANKQGAIILLCHQLSLEQAAQAMALDFPLIGYAKPLKDPLFDWMTYRARIRFGGYVLSRGANMRGLIKDIKNGHMVFYLADEDLGPELSVFSPFFNHQKATLTALPRIARLTKAPVIPCTTWFDANTGRYQVDIGQAFENYPTGDEQTDARILNQWLEQALIDHPQNYLWKLRLFKTRPEGSESVY